MAMTMTMMTTIRAPNRLAFATGLYVCRSWPTLASVHRGTAGQHGERGVIGASSGRRGNLVTCCRRGQGYRKEHEVDYYVPEWPSLSSAPVPERPWAAPGGTPYPASAARQAPMQSLQGGRSTCVTGTARMCGRRLPQWYKCRHSPNLPVRGHVDDETHRRRATCTLSVGTASSARAGMHQFVSDRARKTK